MLRKMLVLWICAVLIFGLCACEKEDPEMLQQQSELELAQSFLEKGDYASAMGVLNSMEIYRQISDKLAEAEQGYQAQKVEEMDWLFAQTWYAADGDMELTFQKEPEPNGEWAVRYSVAGGQEGAYGNRQGKIPFTFMGDVCVLKYFSDFETFVVADLPIDTYQKDGITVLRLAGMEFTTEKAENQEMPLEMVEITMENWQDYFRIKTYEHWEKDDFGETSGLELITYVALKEEYMKRVDLSKSDVTVRFSYGWDLLDTSIDLQTETYERIRVRSSYPEQSETFKLPARLGHPGRDLPDYVGGFFGRSYDPVMNVIGVATNYQITKIEGTLALR